jgi:hypothetical protein
MIRRRKSTAPGGSPHGRFLIGPVADSLVFLGGVFGVQLADVARAGVDDPLADVRHAVGDALQVVPGPQQVGALLDRRLAFAHCRDQHVEQFLVQPVDVVVV